MQERRKTIRNRTFLGGVVAFNKRSSTLDCVVRNFSPEGARIVFDAAVTLPDEFDLEIRQKERAFRARTIWRGETEAGVAFLDNVAQPVERAETAPIPLDWARKLRNCESQKADLQRRVAELSTAD
jgi:PilZ domain